MTLSTAEVWSFVLSSGLLWCVWFYVGRYVGTHNATKEEQRLRREAAADRAEAEQHLADATENLEKAAANLAVRREEIEKEVSERCDRELEQEIARQRVRAEAAVAQAVASRIQTQQRQIENLVDYEFRGELIAADVLLQFTRETGDQETDEEAFGSIYARMRTQGFTPRLRITPGTDTDRIEITQYVQGDEGQPREICIAYMRRSRARLGNVLEHMFPYQPRRRNNVPDAPRVQGIPVVSETHSRNIEL